MVHYGVHRAEVEEVNAAATDILLLKLLYLVKQMDAVSSIMLDPREQLESLLLFLKSRLMRYSYFQVGKSSAIIS